MLKDVSHAHAGSPINTQTIIPLRPVNYASSPRAAWCYLTGGLGCPLGSAPELTILEWNAPRHLHAPLMLLPYQ